MNPPMFSLYKGIDMKKIICVLLVLQILTLTFSVEPLLLAQENNTNDISDIGETQFLELEFPEGISLDESVQISKSKKIDFIEGDYTLNGEQLTFYYINNNQLEQTQAIEVIEERVSGILDSLRKQKDSKEFKQQVNEEAVKKAKSTLRVKKVKIAKAEEYDINTKFRGKKNVHIIKYAKPAPKNKKDKNKKTSLLSKIFTPMTVYAETEQEGGKPCPAKFKIFRKNPYEGDRQDRLMCYQNGAKQRTEGNVYNWAPNECWLDVFEVNSSSNLRQVNCGFQFTQERLDNLCIDENEALESEVIFYNYGPSTTNPNILGSGKAYIYSIDFVSHNIPDDARPYLDTRYLDEVNDDRDDIHKDEFEEPAFGLGMAYANQLQVDTKYWWIMQGNPTTTGGVQNTGLVQLQFQRSYRYDNWQLPKPKPDESNPTTYVVGNGTNLYSNYEWLVYNEEYETFLRPLWFTKNNGGCPTVAPRRYYVTITDELETIGSGKSEIRRPKCNVHIARYGNPQN